MRRQPRTFGVHDAEALAADALAYIADHPGQIERFLALTGILPWEVRSAAAEPGFLAGVLAYLVQHEPDLLAFAAQSGHKPDQVVAAHALLSGQERNFE